jgi:7,8-dihydropterin-6-yl-methyl-4-(beta-D-ribofuranosyl)aminobenzene 5'-phosphate synthase
MSNLNIKEIKELLDELPLNQDKEIISKFITGEKLTQNQIIRSFHMSFPLFTLMVLHKRFEKGKQVSEKEWSLGRLPKFSNVGSVKKLEILPLVDFHAEGNFSTEEGVSYFIKADDIGLLFDTGLNAKDEHPSPLLKNMEVLGISPEDINYIFISHLHGDHVGGAKWASKRSFSLSGLQQNLSHVNAFSPVSMNHPTASVKEVKDPIVIANGIVSIGSIQNPMFFFGQTFEQALAINVEGKGIIVIVGCGHQGIQKIIDRVEALFDVPIYGIIGGLHLPIPEFPGEDITWAGLPIYKFIMTRRPPWKPWQKDDVNFTLDYLKARKLKLVSLSPHDSSMESILAFKETFKEAYIELKVGETIKI